MRMKRNSALLSFFYISTFCLVFLNLDFIWQRTSFPLNRNRKFSSNYRLSKTTNKSFLTQKQRKTENISGFPKFWKNFNNSKIAKKFSLPSRKLENENKNSKYFLKFKDRPFAYKSFEYILFGDRPFENRSFDDRPFENRSFEDRPFENRSFEDRPFEDRPSEKRSFEDRPFEDRPFENRTFKDRPIEDKSSKNRSFEDKPFENRSFQDRPFEDRSFENRTFEDRLIEAKFSENRSFEDKPFEDRPFENRSVEDRLYEDKCLTMENRTLRSEMFEENQNFEFLKTEEGKKYKKILAYNGASRSFYFGFGHKPFEAACCKEKRCFMTDDRSIIPIEDFDAVLIHFQRIKKHKPLPKNRSSHQRWIFYEKEAPPYLLQSSRDFKVDFNWTMTYREDSDIVTGYGRVYNKKDFSLQDFSLFEEFGSSLKTVMKTKKKLVAWMVSQCVTPSNRFQYVSQFMENVWVDIYGGCGKLKCDREKTEKCYEMFERKYKFYFSFENSFCKDYVTEKFFNILSYYIIPVVMGGADYAAIAPPYSYINVEDFESPKDLANYLIYLDKNDTAYMEYFNWKKDYFVLNVNSWLYQASSFCTLCQKLHSDKREKVYSNLTEWFIGEGKCRKLSYSD